MPRLDLSETLVANLPEKLTLQVEFWPKSGRYSVRIWKNGRLVPDPSPILLSMPGMDRPIEPVLGQKDDVLALASKIMDSVKFGIDHQKHNVFIDAKN